ncbi:MAG TPA: cytochrome c oxidase subunit II [Anaerolineaceae bacterium]|jgi:cytochrome c oxidase subunit 2
MTLFKKVGFLIAVSLLLSGCSPTWRVLNPSGPIAGQEAKLFWIVMAMSVVVFLIVDGGLVYILIRNRERKGDTVLPRQIYENRVLETVWTVIPVGIVVVLFILTVVTMRAVAAPPPSANDIKVTVVGHRWFWEFDYPDLGIKTANELHIPAGAHVLLTLNSVDVDHSFWVPELSGKTDVIPGQNNTMWLTTDKIGTYDGQCDEFCGTEHALMRFKVVVDSKADFTTWVAAMQKPPAAPTTALAIQGQQLVTQGVCQGCHTIDGTNMKGTVGPNLTHLHSRNTMAGASFPLDDQYMVPWLQNSEAMKPGNLMSGIHVSDQDVLPILAYLATLK